MHVCVLVCPGMCVCVYTAGHMHARVAHTRILALPLPYALLFPSRLLLPRGAIVTDIETGIVCVCVSLCVPHACVCVVYRVGHTHARLAHTRVLPLPPLRPLVPYSEVIVTDIETEKRRPQLTCDMRVFQCVLPKMSCCRRSVLWKSDSACS